LSSLAADDLMPDRDDTRITADTTIKPGTYRIADTNDDGAIHIEGDGITVDFRNAELVGSADGASPDSFSGCGIVIRGRNITIRNLRVRGYKVGIYAEDAAGLTIEDADVSNNYRQRLKSTPQREDGSDWLFPHRNDEQEWTKNHGAGVSIARADRVTLRRIKAHNGQNGILFDRVSDSNIYDNDCSFLSGWGLGLWRSSRNVISRNAFDFCIRGYSHGVYNRGQDSAGILMFEQCSENIIAENSATHGGDGFFGFAGHEALGEGWLERERERLRRESGKHDVDALVEYPTDLLTTHRRRGNNDNLLINNNFSYAAAHGIELTFSFGNRLIGNRLVANAICGVWGGYSQETLIAGNRFECNGEGAYGMERGGINIEHGSRNVIKHNTFKDNKCGIYLWWDDDAELLTRPWAKANERGSTNNSILFNRFSGEPIGIQLRRTTETQAPFNDLKDLPIGIDADDASRILSGHVAGERFEPPSYVVAGDTRPVVARKHLAGRQNILMTEWGPYDFAHVALVPAKLNGGERAVLQVLGPSGRFAVGKVEGAVSVSPAEGGLPGKLTVMADKPGVHAFTIEVDAAGQALRAFGTLMHADWTVKFFAWDASHDPREDPAAWAELIAGQPLEEQRVSSIDFTWGGGAPSKTVPRDRFATVAVTTVQVPAGKWKVRTVSDDGIRVWVDDQRVIDDWTWHPPKENDAEVEFTEGPHALRIEHFEIDGFAQLQLWIEPAD